MRLGLCWCCSQPAALLGKDEGCLQWHWVGFDGVRKGKGCRACCGSPAEFAGCHHPAHFPVRGFVLLFPKGWDFPWLDGDGAQLGPFRSISAPKSEGVGAVSGGTVVMKGQQLVLEFPIPMAGCPSVTPWSPSYGGTGCAPTSSRDFF